jgi:hypothetical protein
MFRTAKHLKKFSLQAQDGEIGHIRDLYFDDLHWQLRYFAVDTAKGPDHRSVLISPESVHMLDWKRNVLSVDLTQEEIRRSPNLDSDQPVSRQYETALRKHYGWPPYWGAVYGDVSLGLPFSAVTPPAVTEPAEDISSELEGDPHLFNINAVTGYHVVATDGEIGHVDDFLVDDQRWTIRYLIVATRNWWPGKKVILSPWWSSEVNWPERRINMDLSRAAIKASPPYESEQALTAEESGDLHEYYGRPRHPADEEAVGEAIVRSDNPNYP